MRSIYFKLKLFDLQERITFDIEVDTDEGGDNTTPLLEESFFWGVMLLLQCHIEFKSSTGLVLASTAEG